MATRRCPCCQRHFDPHQSQTLPFCSPRCRQIDLGRWLDERYSVPSISLEDLGEETGESAPDGDDAP